MFTTMSTLRMRQQCRGVSAAKVGEGRWRSSTALGRSVDIAVEPGKRNSRLVYAGIDVSAPLSALWDALSAYDRLQTFIPGLEVSRCLNRRPGGARLLQEATQDIALGLRFRARCILDVEEWPRGISQELCWSNTIGDIDEFENQFTMKNTEMIKFPEPRCLLQTSASDISFDLVEGDFFAFRGMWRMQSISPKAEANVSADAVHLTRLSYSLYVRPKQWLPVG
jgi:hypothetical protein